MAALLLGAARAQTPAGPPVAAHVQQVRQLTPEEAGRATKVRLRGVVTALSGWKDSFFLEDATGGISIDRRDNARVRPGDEVEVEGVTGAGLFAPVVISDRVTVTGRRTLRVAKSVSYADLALGRQDSQWVRVRGIVHSAGISESWGRPVLMMTIDLGEGSITARIHDFDPIDFAYLVDSSVQITGVAGTVFNQKRQFIGLRLFVPDIEFLELEEPAPGDPFSVRATSIESLWRFGAAHASSHRIKIVGTVTHQRQGHVLYLQNGASGIAVQSAQTGAVAPGDLVEAVGFVEPGDYAPELHDAAFRKIGGGTPPAPTHIAAAGALETKDGFGYSPYDGLLVELQGDLVDTVWQAGEQVWLVRDGGVVFRAAMPQGAPALRLAALRPGSRLRLTGICVTEADGNREPRAFHLLLRSARDVTILETPWWTKGRLAWLFGLLILVTLGMLAWVLQLRRALPSPEPPFGKDDSRRRNLFRSASQVAALAAAGIGTTVLIGGWVFNVTAIRNLATGYAPMKPNVALGLLLAGFALWLDGGGQATPARRRLSQLLAAVVMVIGALTAMEYAFGVNLHIDELLLQDRTGYAATTSRGRMAPVTAISFLFLGCALVLSQFRRGYAVAQAFVIAVGGVCLLTLVGYLYGIENFYGIAVHTGMAIHTAITLVILCCGVLFSRPDRGLMATISSNAPGGVVARGLLPAALIIPALLGWLRWRGQLAGLYDTAFGLALFASANIVIFALLICICATLLNRLDVQRSQAEAGLRDSKERYRTVVESLPQMVWTCTADGQCDYLSRQWLEYTGLPERDQLGFGWTSQIHQDDRAAISGIWAHAVASGTNFDAEYRIRSKDGSYRWFRALAVPLRNADGAIARWFGTSTDIQQVKTAAAALRESEMRFRELADAMPQMVWTAGPDGSADYYNRRWFEYTGMTMEGLQAGGAQAILHPDDMPNCAERWTRSLHTGEPYEIEYRLKRAAGGAYRWHLGRAVAILDTERRIVRWFGTCTDIEEYKQAESEIRSLNETLEARVQERTAELRESEERFRSLVDGIKDYAIVRLDPMGNVTSWNTGAERIQGYSAAEIVGKHVSCLYTGEDIAKHHAQDMLAVAGVMGQAEEEGWRVRRDGSHFWASVLITALYDETGRICGFSKVTRDVTERRRADERLQQSENDFRALLESAPDAMLIVDQDRRIILVNAQAEHLFGYSRSELLGEPVEKLIRTSEAGAGLNGCRKDGAMFPAEIRSSPIRTAQGSWTASTVRDITDRLRAEQELVAARERAEAANRAKSGFLAAMSHEIRTPMNAILGMADVLWESDLTVDQRQYVEVFRRAGSNLLMLINDILDLSRIEAGHLELEHVEFDLEEVIDQAMELCGAKARSKGITLLSRLSPGLATAMIGDPTRLRQVLINLLGNAVKFTASGEIVLSVRNAESAEPGRIDFSISDTGIGIAPDKLAVIFDDFTQADSSTTRRYGGTGLGLGISRRLVQAMGGRLSAASSLGKGSTFQFSALFEPAPEGTRKGSTTVEDFSGRRVLVMDDNATNRLILRETLETWGLVTAEFDAPEQAVATLVDAAAARQPYSLVILDNHMPQAGGFEVAAQIRKKGLDIPIIMLTSDTHFGDAERRRRSGLSGYAVKPVKRADLLRLVCDALAARPEHELQSKVMPLENQEKQSTAGLRILVVEDSPDNRLLVQVYLKGTAHALTFAEDGKAAVDRFLEGGFDLVLMDIQMPVMDGLAATRAIRLAEQQRGLTPLPIISLTANARPEDINASQEAGCNSHLTKPISKQKLLAAIDEYRSALRISIPEGFEELTPGYLAARRNELAELNRLLANSDFGQLQILAHNMKGNGTSYGFPDLTRIGASLETSARDQDPETLRAGLTELAGYLARVQLTGT